MMGDRDRDDGDDNDGDNGDEDVMVWWCVGCYDGGDAGGDDDDDVDGDDGNVDDYHRTAGNTPYRNLVAPFRFIRFGWKVFILSITCTRF